MHASSMGATDPTAIPKECSVEIFLMLKYIVACANNYFRTLHHEGLWMEPNTNLLVAKAGNEMCASRHSCLMTLEILYLLSRGT